MDWQRPTGVAVAGPVKSENRNGGTHSETLERLVGDDSLADVADDVAEAESEFSVEEATDGARAPPPSVEE